MPEAPEYRCYDDQCRVRATCHWWHIREGGHGKVAMTWRLGYEDHTLPCGRWEPARVMTPHRDGAQPWPGTPIKQWYAGETVERCVTYE